MLSQGVIDEAEHASKQLGVDSSQSRLHFDDDGEPLLKIFQGNHQRVVLLSPTYLGPMGSRAHDTTHPRQYRVSRVPLPARSPGSA